MLTRVAGLLWRQRRLLVASALLIAVAGLVAWQLLPRDYTAQQSLTWTGDAGYSVTADDLASRGDQMVAYATSDQLLTELVPVFGSTRDLAQLRSEIDVRWDRATSRLVISVTDTDGEVARQIAGALATTLPTYGPDTAGLISFAAGEPGDDQLRERRDGARLRGRAGAGRDPRHGAGVVA